jgi:hypothetical protein
MATGTYQKLKAGEAPRRKRRSVSRMEALPQWKLMRDDLEKHKMTPNEVRQITVTPDDRRKHRIQSRRTMVRAVANFIAEHNLPYRIVSFNRDGDDYVQVRYTPVGKAPRRTEGGG